jgi:hypothetical protein
VKRDLGELEETQGVVLHGICTSKNPMQILLNGHVGALGRPPKSEKTSGKMLTKDRFLHNTGSACTFQAVDK